MRGKGTSVTAPTTDKVTTPSRHEGTSTDTDEGTSPPRKKARQEEVNCYRRRDRNVANASSRRAAIAQRQQLCGANAYIEESTSANPPQEAHTEVPTTSDADAQPDGDLSSGDDPPIPPGWPTVRVNRNPRDGEAYFEGLYDYGQTPTWYKQWRERRISFWDFGGPIDNTVLYEYDSHTAYHIARGEERPTLIRRHHKGWKSAWDYSTNKNAEFKRRVEESGLLDVKKFHPESFSMSLVSALIERWMPETNTFHLPFGESTITLDDVRMITGLKVEGIVPSSPRPQSQERAKELVERTLGLNRQQVDSLFHIKKGQGVLLKGVADFFENSLDENSTGEVVERCVRAYIFYILGRTIFIDKSGDRLSAHHLEDLEDVSKIKDVAFGLGCLENVYNRLGEASRHTTSMLAGYMPLVEIWAYSRIPSFLHSLTKTREDWNENHKKPLITKWKIHTYAEKNEPQLRVQWRQRIDDLKMEQFVWQPYGAGHAFPDICLYSGIIFWHEEREPYLPERVLPQFGFRPMLPYLPPIPCSQRYTRRTPPRGSLYVAVFPPVLNFEQHVKENVLARDQCARLKTTDDEYNEWYRITGHPRVCAPPDQNSNRRLTLIKLLRTTRDKLKDGSKAYKEAIETIPGLKAKMKRVFDILEGRVRARKRL